MNMNESSLTMVLHAVVIGIVVFIALVYGVKHPKDKSVDKSVLLAAIALAYMVVFGHNMPSRDINTNLLL
jgi:hypothetical protein